MTEVNQIAMEKEKKPKKSLTYQNQKRIWAAIFLTPWVVGFLLLFLVPLITSLSYSFNHVSIGTGGGINTVWVGLENYRYALFEHTKGTTIFQLEMLTTIQDVAINLPVIMIFSLFIATILNTEFRGRAIVRAIFFIPVILNSAAVASAMSSGQLMTDALTDSGGFGAIFELDQYLLRAGVGTGLVGLVVGLVERIYSILALSGVPILLFLASIQSIPRHLYEAAEIEGATKYEMFWLITLPNVKPHLITVAIYVLIDTFLTSPVSAYINRLSTTEWGLNAAMSWLYVLVVLVILMIIAVIAKIFKWGESHYD